MKEKLGVSVDAGTVEKLRKLAGGERKVGELISELTSFLWRERSVLARSSLVDCRLWDQHGADELKKVSSRLEVIEDMLREKGITNAANMDERMGEIMPVKAGKQENGHK